MEYTKDIEVDLAIQIQDKKAEYYSSISQNEALAIVDKKDPIIAGKIRNA